MKLGNKRAEWTVLKTMMIIAGILVAFILVSIVLRATSKEIAESDFLAKDSALLADVILGAPQDVQIVYPNEFTKQYARLGNDSIGIFLNQPEPDEIPPLSYFFIPNEGIKVKETEFKINAFFMIKQGDSFTISNVPLQQEVQKEAPAK